MENAMKYFKLITTFFLLISQAFATSWSINGANKTDTQSIIQQVTRQEAFLDQLDPQQFKNQINHIIRSILQPEGYYNSEIFVDPKNKHHITITPHQPVRISQIRLSLPQPINNPSFIKTINHLTGPFQKKRFTLSNYEKIKALFLKLCKEQGYLNASILDTTAHVDTDTFTANINLKVKLGPQYIFKSFIIENLPYSVTLIERFGKLHANTPFQPEQVDALNNNLLRSGLFKTLDVKSLVNEQDKTVSVKVSGTPIKSHNWSVALGFNEINNINVTYKNTLNRLSQEADQLTTQFSLMMPNESNNDFPFSGSLDYTQPGINPLTDFWSLQLNTDHLFSVAGQKLNRIQSSINYHRRYPMDSIDLALNLQSESIVSPIPSQSSLLYPSISTHHIRTQTSMIPYDRSRIRTTSSFGITNISEKQYFLRLHNGIRGAFDLGQKFTLYQDLDLENLLSKEYNNLPTNIQIYVGGAYTLRGYENQTIGRPTGLDPHWINHAFLYSHELDYHLNDTYSIGAFVDSAVIHETDKSINTYHSYGLSGNMNLPMGLLQISLGKAAKKDASALIQIRFIPGLRTLDS
jgi:translocation and assembly module TamA